MAMDHDDHEMAASDDTDMADMDHDDHANHEDHDESGRLPNEGAAIRIVSPADGDQVSAEDFVIEVEIDNFDIGEGDRHWHVYIDGTTWGMIMSQSTSFAVHGVDPGEHEVAVYLSIETHEELEDGDVITVTVE